MKQRIAILLMIGVISAGCVSTDEIGVWNSTPDAQRVHVMISAGPDVVLDETYEVAPYANVRAPLPRLRGPHTVTASNATLMTDRMVDLEGIAEHIGVYVRTDGITIAVAHGD